MSQPENQDRKEALNSDVFKIRLTGLTRLDQLDLASRLPKADVVIGTSRSNDKQYEDLGLTAAVVIVSLAALRVLAIVFAKRRDKTHITETFEVESPDGTRSTATIEFDTQSDTLEKDILQQLATACNVDTSELLAHSE